MTRLKTSLLGGGCQRGPHCGFCFQGKVRPRHGALVETPTPGLMKMSLIPTQAHQTCQGRFSLTPTPPQSGKGSSPPQDLPAVSVPSAGTPEDSCSPTPAICWTPQLGQKGPPRRHPRACSGRARSQSQSWRAASATGQGGGGTLGAVQDLPWDTGGAGRAVLLPQSRVGPLL